MFSLDTHLDPSQPFILECLVDTPSCFRIGIEHVFDDTSTFPRNEVVDRGWSGLMCPRLALREILLGVGGKGRVGGLGYSPWQFLELHAVEDDGRGPDVDEASIIF